MSSPRSRGQPLAHHPEFRVRHVAHRRGQFGVALVPDQAGDRDDHHAVRRHAELGADARARRRIGPEHAPGRGRCRSAMASRQMCSRRASAASLVRDGQEHVGDARRRSIPWRTPAARRSHEPVLVEQEAVAGIGDARHPGDPRRQPRQEAADRHMRVHEVGLLAPGTAHQGAEGAPDAPAARGGARTAGRRRGTPRRARSSSSGPSAQTPTTSWPRARMPRISGSRKCRSEKSTLVISMIFTVSAVSDSGA